MNTKNKIFSAVALAFTVIPLLGAGSVGAVSMTKPTYRFYDRNVGAHFFTSNKEERDTVIANDPRWSEENKAFEVVDYNNNSCADEMSMEVYRFYRPTTKTHFYTQNKTERDTVIANDKSWNYENVAFCAYTEELEGTDPVYRFYREATGSHFFTANQGERDYLLAYDPSWRFEGIAYYAHPLVDIIDTLESKGDFTVLLSAIDAAGLTNKLRTEGKFTLFAPTDEAFAELESTNPGTLAALMSDPQGDLKQILLYHLLGSEVVEYEARALTSATTLQGSNVDLSVNSENMLMVDDAKVLETDVHASNGVIHPIDKVLMPEGTMTPSPTPTMTATPTVTAEPTVIPTVTVEPTITVAPTITIEPTVTPV